MRGDFSHHLCLHGHGSGLREENVPGRLIPVPRAISAGCGMCWAAPKECRSTLEELVIRRKLMIDGIYAILL